MAVVADALEHGKRRTSFAQQTQLTEPEKMIAELALYEIRISPEVVEVVTKRVPVVLGSLGPVVDRFAAEQIGEWVARVADAPET